MANPRPKLGVIGCGNISGIYLQNLAKFGLEVAACADLDRAKAEVRAKEFGIRRSCSTEEMLEDPEIAVVVNLPVPKAHAPVALAALRAGKSVYGEKPLAVTRAEGKKVLDAAKRRKLRVGSAPDTFLGAGLQTCRKLVDGGAIGEPVAAVAFMTCHGHESWHPDPEFYYEKGGGPVLDMGPYYLTALVSILGPVRRVTGSARISFPERTITSEPKKGKRIRVEVPTHVAGVLDFACGAVVTLVMSFDVWAANLPRIEIYGSEGSLAVPDPNCFGGPVRIRRAQDADWSELPVTRPYAENSRGLGVAEMVRSMEAKRPHRASGELAYHVLDVMESLHVASRQGRHVKIASTCERPRPLPEGLKDWELD